MTAVTAATTNNGEAWDVLLRRCTARVRVAKGDGGESWGTAFFVAPSLLLTCAHVVVDERARPHPGPVLLDWDGIEAIPAELRSFHPTIPDLALLSIDVKEHPGLNSHPCVRLDESANVDDPVYSYGYPERRRDGDPVTAQVEGWGPFFKGSGMGADAAHETLKLKGGQVQQGVSGAPLLNRRTQGVCGVVKLSRNVNSDLGAVAISTAMVFKYFPELRELQAEYHVRHPSLWPPAPTVGTERSVFPVYVRLPELGEGRLIGRDADINKVKDLLHPGTKAVLDGGTGVGKSSLTTVLAHDQKMRERFRDGILAAPLGPNPDVLGLLGSWCKALGINGYENLTTPEERGTAIKDSIQERNLLLIIDDVWDVKQAQNFELGGASCAHLFTTRVREHARYLVDDSVVQIHPLSTEAAIDLLEGSAKVKDRLKAEGVKEKAKELVEEVGCLPLALTIIGKHLEQKHDHLLLSHWIASDWVAAIEHLLESLRKVDVSRLPVDDNLPGHLWQTFEVTFQALEAVWQDRLRQLAVFPSDPGTFSLDAALSVMDITRDEWLGSPHSRRMDPLRSGLVRSNGANPLRYTIHRAVTTYLRQQPPDGKTYRRMVRHYIDLVDHITEHNLHTDYVALESENQNLLAVLETADKKGLDEDLVRAANSFYDYMEAKGLHMGARTYLEKAEKAAEKLPETERKAKVLILLHTGRLEEKSGDYNAAERKLERGLELVGRDFAKEANQLLYHLSIVEYNQAKYKEAEKHLEQGLKRAQTTGNQDGMLPYLLQRRGLVALSLGRYRKAARYEMEGLRLARNQGNLEQIIACLADLGRLALKLEDYERAATFVHEGLELLKSRDRREHSFALKQIQARVALEKEGSEELRAIKQEGALTGQAFQTAEDAAEFCIKQSLEEAKAIKYWWYVSFLQHEYGKIHLRRHDYNAAYDTFESALEHAKKWKMRDLKGYALFGRARADYGRRNVEAARRDAAKSVSLFRTIGHHMVEEVDQWLAGLSLENRCV